MKTKISKVMMCVFLAAMVATGCEHRYYEGNEHRRGRGYYLHNKHYLHHYHNGRGNSDDHR
jgi:hypothetical protein